jgi:hypothetical protein
MRDLRALFVCWFFAMTLGISALAQTSNQSDQPQPSGSSATAQASSQPEQAQHPGTSEGTVESVGPQTMLVRTDDNQSQLFTFDNPTVQPKGLTAGDRVRITYRPADEAGVRRVTGVTILNTAATPQSGITQTMSPQQSSSTPPSQTSSQPDQAQHPGTNEGTAESVGHQTMLVRTEDNQPHLFIFDNPTVRPKGLTAGTRVRIISNPTDEAGVRRAIRVTILDAAATPQSGIAQDTAPPPKELTSVQRDIERTARRWGLGARIGAGLDPEVFLIGVHAGIGPIFSRDFYFRPNVEFAFGELTDMVALNLEGVYRLPITFREGRWSAYVGAGPGLNFVHQGVDTSDTSFSNFNYETGFNMFTGIRFRGGTFGEVKTSLWAGGVPTLRFILGYTF